MSNPVSEWHLIYPGHPDPSVAESEVPTAEEVKEMHDLERNIPFNAASVISIAAEERNAFIRAGMRPDTKAKLRIEQLENQVNRLTESNHKRKYECAVAVSYVATLHQCLSDAIARVSELENEFQRLELPIPHGPSTKLQNESRQALDSIPQPIEVLVHAALEAAPSNLEAQQQAMEHAQALEKAHQMAANRTRRTRPKAPIPDQSAQPSPEAASSTNRKAYAAVLGAEDDEPQAIDAGLELLTSLTHVLPPTLQKTRTSGSGIELDVRNASEATSVAPGLSSPASILMPQPDASLVPVEVTSVYSPGQLARQSVSGPETDSMDVSGSKGHTSGEGAMAIPDADIPISKRVESTRTALNPVAMETPLRPSLVQPSPLVKAATTTGLPTPQASEAQDATSATHTQAALPTASSAASPHSDPDSATQTPLVVPAQGNSHSLPMTINDKLYPGRPSRSGRPGRVEGYVMEGDELDFYKKLIEAKKAGKRVEASCALSSTAAPAASPAPPSSAATNPPAEPHVPPIGTRPLISPGSMPTLPASLLPSSLPSSGVAPLATSRTTPGTTPTLTPTPGAATSTASPPTSLAASAAEVLAKLGVPLTGPLAALAQTSSGSGVTTPVTTPPVATSTPLQNPTTSPTAALPSVTKSVSASPTLTGAPSPLSETLKYTLRSTPTAPSLALSKPAAATTSTAGSNSAAVPATGSTSAPSTASVIQSILGGSSQVAKDGKESGAGAGNQAPVPSHSQPPSSSTNSGSSLGTSPSKDSQSQK